MLASGRTKEDEVDPILVQQGLHLPLEALHLLVVLIVGVVAARKGLVSSGKDRASAIGHRKTALSNSKKKVGVSAWACKHPNAANIERHRVSRSDCRNGQQTLVYQHWLAKFYSQASFHQANTEKFLLCRVWQTLKVSQGFCSRSKGVRLTTAGASEQSAKVSCSC